MKRKAPVKLTQAVVDRLKIENGKRDEIWFDKEMHGFGLRIRSDGKNEHRTFVAQYKIGPKHRRVTLGNVDKVRFDDAKKKAKEIFGRVAIGEDPAGKKIAARAEASSALGAIIEAYLEVAKERLRPRSYEASEHRLKRLWKPLHGLTIGAVSRAIIAARMATICWPGLYPQRLRDGTHAPRNQGGLTRRAPASRR